MDAYGDAIAVRIRRRGRTTASLDWLYLASICFLDAMICSNTELTNIQSNPTVTHIHSQQGNYEASDCSTEKQAWNLDTYLSSGLPQLDEVAVHVCDSLVQNSFGIFRTLHCTQSTPNINSKSLQYQAKSRKQAAIPSLPTTLDDAPSELSNTTCPERFHAVYKSQQHQVAYKITVSGLAIAL